MAIISKLFKFGLRYKCQISTSSIQKETPKRTLAKLEMILRIVRIVPLLER